MLHGPKQVFRKLKQLVPEFNAYLSANAVQNAAGVLFFSSSAVQIRSTVTHNNMNLFPGTLTQQQGADLLGARMIGRWKSGAPVDLSPTVDDPTLGADPERNNNFNYGHLLSSLNTDQSRCPFSAHIRKTRPRSDQLNLNLLNQGTRGGIPFGPEVSSTEASSGQTTQERGLAFGKRHASVL